jgi:hypothetical protein
MRAKRLPSRAVAPSGMCLLVQGQDLTLRPSCVVHSPKELARGRFYTAQDSAQMPGKRDEDDCN